MCIRDSYTHVTGMPEAGDINDIALAYASDTDKGTVTFELMTTSGAVLYLSLIHI